MCGHSILRRILIVIGVLAVIPGTVGIGKLTGSKTGLADRCGNKDLSGIFPQSSPAEGETPMVAKL